MPRSAKATTKKAEGETVKAPKRTQRGIQSIEVGTRVLAALLRYGRPMALRDVAQEAAMPSTKAHAYLVSFGKGGLVKQHPLTGHYELGPMALQLGLSALQQLDPVTEAIPEATLLAEKTNLSVALSVWGDLGPTIVRFDEPNYPTHVNMRVGTLMSLLNTVTGRVYAAYMPPKLIEKMIAEEHSRVVGGPSSSVPREQLEKVLSEVRKSGMGRGVGLPIPGINALCAPIFDHHGQIVAAVTLIGPQGIFNPDLKGDIAKMLKSQTEAVSKRLGYTIA